MRFKIDENLPVEVAELLRQRGHEAATVREQDLGGEADAGIAAVCRQEQRALITLDADFADARTYPPGAYHGIVVLRLRRQEKQYVLRFVERLAAAFERETVQGRLWIVDESTIRIRS